jgi:hypothetical protein
LLVFPASIPSNAFQIRAKSGMPRAVIITAQVLASSRPDVLSETCPALTILKQSRHLPKEPKAIPK